MIRSKVSAALLVACMLSACGPETNGLTPVSNPSLYSVNQPVVQRSDFIMDLAASGAGIPADQRAQLANWFDSLELRYGDRVYVDEQGYSDPRNRADIEAIAADYGLLLSEGVPFSAGAPMPGLVRVIVSRTRASVPGCPIWEDQTVGAPETTSTNFGCATNSNLASMIADPDDLVRGQTGSGKRDAEQGSKAIKLYRERKPGSGSK